MPARFTPTVPSRPGERPASIGFAELPAWVPGEILCASDDLHWRGVGQRTYRYHGQDVEIPPMDCFMIVQYEQGFTPMQRQFDGRWTRTSCGSGQFSLLSNAADSHWHWTEGIVVSHIYLDGGLLCRLASEMQGQAVDRVRLHDVLSGTDPVVSQLTALLRQEAATGSAGCSLYAEALSTQLGVHLLRHYAVCHYRAPAAAARMSPAQAQRLQDYVDAHLASLIGLEDMARALGLGVCGLSRLLRATWGTSAYRYVVDRRVERASALARRGDMPLKAIAAATGFADQAHMTRTLRARLGVTPGQLRERH
jgi:AraC family transcriptional regulator